MKFQQRIFSSGVAVLSCDHSILCSEIKVYIFFTINSNWTGRPTLNFTSTVTTVERTEELGTPFDASNGIFARTKFVAKGPKTNWLKGLSQSARFDHLRASWSLLLWQTGIRSLRYIAGVPDPTPSSPPKFSFLGQVGACTNIWYQYQWLIATDFTQLRDKSDAE